MGIPSYFSFIIKNHQKIITTLQNIRNQPLSQTFHHLFFDANSIIYDAFHKLAKEYSETHNPDLLNQQTFFQTLSENVIQILEQHIQFIQPEHTLFIAFDGIPPPAKIVQQRSRRFKTKHLEKLTAEFLSQITSNPQEQLPQNTNTKTFPWQTNMITPGTPFMIFLSNQLENYFQTHLKNNKTKTNTKIQILSTSEHPGEGEHKIFQYLRENPPKTNENIAIYGLDSDLIMLSLLSVPNIYIFREAPVFLSNKIDHILIKNQHHNHNTQNHNQNQPQTHSANQESYFLDINQFKTAIQETTHKVYDYVFMCFLLGNDFLPHIACLNLRNQGLHTLLKYYSQTNPTLVDPKTLEIQWHDLHKLLKPIAKQERELLIQENAAFSKMPYPVYGKTQPNKTQQTKTQNETQNKNQISKSEIQEYIQNAPYFFSKPIRQYIQPECKNDTWKQRYHEIYNHACPKRYLKQMHDTWHYYLGNITQLAHTTMHPPLLSEMVEVLDSQTQNNPQQAFENLPPLTEFHFQSNQEYLAYVLSDEPMHYHFGFEKFLWEVSVYS